MQFIHRLMKSQVRSFSSSMQFNSQFVPTFIRKRISMPSVAILHLTGAIQANMNRGRSKSLNISSVEKSIDKAFALKRLKAVYLVVNSPGGSAAQSELIAKKIIRLGEEKKVDVISFVEDIAASGGYWLACAGKEIYVCENSWVGSIGALMAVFGLNEFISRHGIDWRIHTAGKSKAFLDPFQPEKEEDVEKVKILLKHVHHNFKEFVKGRRGSRLNGSDELLFNGDAWLGQQAVDFGLVDGIKHLDSYIVEKHGIVGKDVNVVKLNANQGFLSFLQTQSLEDIQNVMLSQKYRIM